MSKSKKQEQQVQEQQVQEQQVQEQQVQEQQVQYTLGEAGNAVLYYLLHPQATTDEICSALGQERNPKGEAKSTGIRISGIRQVVEAGYIVTCTIPEGGLQAQAHKRSAGTGAGKQALQEALQAQAQALQEAQEEALQAQAQALQEAQAQAQAQLVQACLQLLRAGVLPAGMPEDVQEQAQALYAQEQVQEQVQVLDALATMLQCHWSAVPARVQALLDAQEQVQA